MKTTTGSTMALIAALAFSVFLFTFCTQTVENEKGEAEVMNTDDILKEFQTVGLLHNKVMAEVIEDFRHHNRQFEERSHYFSFLEQSLLHNLSAKSFLSSVGKDEIKSTVKELLSHIEASGQDDKTEDGLADLVSGSLYIMSPELSTLLQQVDDIVMTASSNAQLLTSLQNISNSPLVQTLSYEDKHIFYAVIAVGIESTQYWEQNLDYWIYTLTEYDLSDFESVQWFNFDGRQIIRGDIKGGLVGAIGGCMAGALAGGVGCGPGAVSGGLIGSATYSAGEAISQILDSIF